MNNKKIIYLFALIILLVFGILVVFVFDINCILKTVADIPCPGCGLTRGVRELIHGHILKAEMYNILTIPIVLFLGIYVVLLIIDFIKKSNMLEKFLSYFVKHYKVLLILIIITWILNIVHKI